MVPITLAAGEDGPAGAVGGLVHCRRAALAVHGKTRGRLPRAPKRREELDYEEKAEDTVAGEAYEHGRIAGVRGKLEKEMFFSFEGLEKEMVGLRNCLSRDRGGPEYSCPNGPARWHVYGPTGWI